MRGKGVLVGLIQLPIKRAAFDRRVIAGDVLTTTKSAPPSCKTNESPGLKSPSFI